MGANSPCLEVAERGLRMSHLEDQCQHRTEPQQPKFIHTVTLFENIYLLAYLRIYAIIQ